MSEKLNAINRIGDKHRITLKDFVIFEDNWITEHDAILVDPVTEEEYTILKHKEVVDLVIILRMPNGRHIWGDVTRTAVILDKKVNLEQEFIVKK